MDPQDQMEDKAPRETKVLQEVKESKDQEEDRVSMVPMELMETTEKTVDGDPEDQLDHEDPPEYRD